MLVSSWAANDLYLKYRHFISIIILKEILLIYFGHNYVACGILDPWPGVEPDRGQRRALHAGPPGNSLKYRHFKQ